MLQRKEQQGIVKAVEEAIHIFENSNLMQLSEGVQQSVPEGLHQGGLVGSQIWF